MTKELNILSECPRSLLGSDLLRTKGVNYFISDTLSDMNIYHPHLEDYVRSRACKGRFNRDYAFGATISYSIYANPNHAAPYGDIKLSRDDIELLKLDVKDYGGDLALFGLVWMAKFPDFSDRISRESGILIGDYIAYYSGFAEAAWPFNSKINEAAMFRSGIWKQVIKKRWSNR